MKQYQDFLHHILQNGRHKANRTGVDTVGVFGYQMRFNLADGFPLVTSKKVPWRSVVAELLWFLSGSTNNNDLRAVGCTIWDEWAREDGSLGPIYGKQWTQWTGNVIDVAADPGTGPGMQEITVTHELINQIARVVESIKNDPNGRRHIVSAWNPADLPQMALAPCHALFQFDVTGGRLSCQLYQRSADAFLGVPFNIASYAALTHMVAQQCHLEVGDFIWTGGDCHVYRNHFEQAAELLSRVPRDLPYLDLRRKPASIFEYQLDDFSLERYNPHPAISAPVAV